MFANETLNFLLLKSYIYKILSGFRCTTMKLNGKFLRSRRSSLVRDLHPIPASSIIVRNSGSDLMGRRDISIRLLSCNILITFLSNSNLICYSKLICFLRSWSRLMVAPDELGSRWNS